MRDVQRVVIVDPSDATREPLRNLMLGVESIWLESECSRYEFFFDVVHQSHPDVAVVSLDADENKALQLIAQLTSEVPDLPILAVSAKGDGQSILKALRSGAREFLTQPVVLVYVPSPNGNVMRHRAAATPSAQTRSERSRRATRSTASRGIPGMAIKIPLCGTLRWTRRSSSSPGGSRLPRRAARSS